MKMTLSFISGIIVCGLLFFGVQSALPILAQTDDESDNLSALSANLSQSLINFLPDIEKIYRDAITTPLQEAEKKIYDDDIADFYQALLKRTALDKP
ncbi:hypothetical protein ACFLUO_07705 [Chloroflexota bacterium]